MIYSILLTLNLTAGALGASAHALWPEVSAAQAEQHAAAAQAAATPELPAELLLAVAVTESDFVATTVSNVGGSLFCGPLQAMAGRSRARCRALADLATGYAAGADELTYWLGRTHGDVATALAHHACGNEARGRKCRAYAGRVLRRYRALVARLPTS